LRWKNLFQKTELRLHHRFVINGVERVQPLAFWFKRVEQGCILRIGDGGEVEINWM